MAFRSIHVGGTNGKGSVAAMIAAVLDAAGMKVGLYTSPHLVDFNERIRISGRPVDPAQLDSSAHRLRPLARELGATFFETTTALAFNCFAESGVDMVVAEVGLGGRLDSTNVLLPEVSVITQVAWDHAEYLGTSLSAIAREKAGICKPGVPLVLGPLPPEADSSTRHAAEAAGAPVIQLGRDANIRAVRLTDQHTDLEYAGLRSDEPIMLSCPLLGEHQAHNAGLAALACEILHASIRPTSSHVKAGIAGLAWPGRLQIERREGRTWVLDVAHNPAAMEALARTMAGLELPCPRVSVVAILGDKPWKAMLSPLLEASERAIFTVAPSAPAERRWDPQEVAAYVRGYPVEVEPDFGSAMNRAAQLGATIIVTGSNHTVGDAMKHLGVEAGLPCSSWSG